MQNITLADIAIEFIPVIKLQSEVKVAWRLNDYSALSICI
ncbi:hypothetical protein THF1C08_130151 [Vibrio jasicida]|uniref:Uncharacterized protein n=1 Tax=Vibrio jasicida TaxID=766224 RepID=A0AAU9QI87_9VIBR|nr:hypothetical protein THF1C08_130151 [Vibrio jasicida]CAH1573778.1 hypothetical protein THF1A12_120148 [Vibrio jasicida]